MTDLDAALAAEEHRPRPLQPGGGCRDCVWTWDIRQGGRWVRQCDECGKGKS